MKAKLLVIEPDVFERDILSKVLSDRYDIYFSVNIKSAHETYQEVEPQIVLLHVQLPDIETLEEFCKIKKQWQVGLPVILIISENSLEFERYARTQNIFFYYMIKPYDFKELEEVLVSAMRLSLKNKSNGEMPAAKEKM